MAQAKCAFAFVVEVKKGRRCREHGHPCTEIVLCHRGAGTLVQAGHRYPYRDGSLLVYEPGQTHWIEPRTGGWHICVGVIGCEVTTIPPGVHASNGRLRQLFGDVRDALEHTSARQQLRLDLLAGLIAVELSELTCRATAPTHAQRAREIIEHSFHEPLSVRALAEKIYISPDYLRQVFRREFGESLMHYLIQIGRAHV